MSKSVNDKLYDKTVLSLLNLQKLSRREQREVLKLLNKLDCRHC